MEPFEGGPGEVDEPKSNQPSDGFTQAAAAKMLLPVIVMAGLAFAGAVFVAGISLLWIRDENPQGLVPMFILVIPLLLINGITLWKTNRARSTERAKALAAGGGILVLFGMVGLSCLAVAIAFVVCTFSVAPGTSYH